MLHGNLTDNFADEIALQLAESPFGFAVNWERMLSIAGSLFGIEQEIGGGTMHINSSHEAFGPVRDALVEAAREGRLLTYPDVAAIMGLPRTGQAMGLKVGAMGDAINEYEQQAGCPMLSALIVKTRSRMPGPGFYDGAIEFGRATDFIDDLSKRAFWESERDAIYAKWGS